MVRIYLQRVLDREEDSPKKEQAVNRERQHLEALREWHDNNPQREFSLKFDVYSRPEPKNLISIERFEKLESKTDRFMVSDVYRRYVIQISYKLTISSVMLYLTHDIFLSR